MSPNPAPNIAALVEHFFRRRGEGRRLSVDDVLAEAGSSADAMTRAAVIDRISRCVRNGSSAMAGGDAFAPPVDIAIPAAGLLPDIPGYDLIEEIGRGGMGVVYEAYQRSTGRRVAVKFISEHVAGSDAARRRFEREVELVARLSHPGIVSVFDSGIHRDRCFCALDFVDGFTLDEHVRRIQKAGSQKTRLADLVALMATICDAVDYAHQRGVLHRDLKPSNILVDAHGRPHILDFGLAKDIDPLTAEGRALTIAEPGQVLGTLAYMAPEQARGAFHEISVRSDVYSLGAIAYEALTGRLPCSTDGALHDVLDRIQHQDPPIPSAIPTDLGAILLKALDKVPDRRYATARELAADLRCFLADEPVSARPAGRWYQFRKFARRHRALVWGTSATFIALALGFGMSLVLYFQAVAARAEAERRQKETDKVATFQGAMLSRLDAEELGRTIRQEQRRIVEDGLRRRWISGDDGQMRKMTDGEVAAALARFDEALAPGNDTDVARHTMASSVLKRAEDAIPREFADQPEVAAALHNSMGAIYKSLGLYEAAEPHFRTAVELLRGVHGEEHVAVARALNDLGSLLTEKGSYVDAEAPLRAALDMRRKLLGEEHLDVAESMTEMAILLYEKREYAAAEPFYRAALDIRRKRLGDDDPLVGASMKNLATLLSSMEHNAEAIPLCRQALEIQRRVWGDDHPEVAQTIHNLASMVDADGHTDEAIPLEREALDIGRRVHGEGHPRMATGFWNLAWMLKAQGDLDAAEPALREALALYRKGMGEEHEQVAAALDGLARLICAKKDFEQAESLEREALAMRRRLFGNDHADIAASLSTLASILFAREDYAGAEDAGLQTVAMRRRLFGPESASVASSLWNLGQVQKAAGHLDAAEQTYHESLAIYRKVRGDENPDVADILHALGTVRQAKGDLPGAKELLTQALAMRERVLAPGHADIAASRLALANVLIALKQFADAESLLLPAAPPAAENNNPAAHPDPQLLDALVQLYEAWHAAEPDRGHDQKAAEWRSRRAEFAAATQPASKNGA